MAIWEYEATLPYPIEEVFALTVDLERAPHWHSIFSGVSARTPPPIGEGSRWAIRIGPTRFFLTLIEVEPPRRAAFQGNSFLGMVPNFEILMAPLDGGTRVRYRIDPTLPTLFRPLMVRIIPPYGTWDLGRYFRELEARLAAATHAGNPAA